MTKAAGQELVVGLVGATGSDLDKVTAALRSALRTVNYKSYDIRLSGLLADIPNPPWEGLPKTPEEKRLEMHMNAGDAFRKSLQRTDAMALLAIGAIRDLRAKNSGKDNEPAERAAFLLRSLKTPLEIETLRLVYGNRAIILAAYSPRDSRIENLARRIAASHHEFDSVKYRAAAEEIVQRDEAGKQEDPFGQNIRDAFPLADVFVDLSAGEGLSRSITRLVEILFGHPFHTPTPEEFGMFHAQAAALRSASLGRQVGAAILTNEGDIVSVGTNEVPKAGGGQYWPDREPDHRDHILGFDSNDKLKRRLLADVLKRLKDHGWLAKESGDDINKLVEEAVAGKPTPLMKGAQIMNLLEFGRAVHAEMAALMDAARRGVAVGGCTLYSTTFPCHECARHIVGAGIRRVQYVEPYPKSLVPELYPDSICVEEKPGTEQKVSFESFVGVAPRRYLDLFTMVPRKQLDGTIVEWEPARSEYRLGRGSSQPTDLIREKEEFARFKLQMEEVRLVEKNDSALNPKSGFKRTKE